MKSLNRDMLDAIRQAGQVAVGTEPSGPERILQIGEGNFLRAFADWMVHRANSAGTFDGSIVVVQPRDRKQGTVATLNEQDGLYTVLVRGRSDEGIVDNAELVCCIHRGINPYRQWDEFLACADQPALRFLLSNTTEAGVVYHPEPQPTDACPVSFPAKVVALLLRRYRHFGGSAKSGMVILPCELIDRNGDTLKRIVLQLCDDWHLEADFVRWINEHNYFLNTLVDRIVPGYPAAEADTLADRLGYDDKLTVAAEPYHIWVIEGPAELAEELPLAEAGCNVIWTDDLTMYRYQKVRILNGAHMTLVPTAFMAGEDIVGESLDDPIVGGYLKAALDEEILPTLAMAPQAKTDYAAATLQRFANPFIKHALLSIALNSVAKFPVRLLPTLLEYVDQRGQVPRRMTLALSAMLAFYRGTEFVDGILQGSRAGQAYPINDSTEVLDYFAGLWRRYDDDGDLAGLIRDALAQERFWGCDLNQTPGVTEVVAEQLPAILDGRIRDLMAELQA